MTETSRTNLEIATELNRQKFVAPSRLHRVLEVLEALLLAMVAISTAWSGYQAARWDGVQSECYGRSSRLRVEGQALDGPMAMLEFRNAKTDEAISRNREATDLFERGTRARERGEDYVRVTVFLATVLLLTAISQRFRSVQARAVLAAIAFLMLCIPVWLIFTLPRT